MTKCDLSYVIPVLNEGNNIKVLMEQIASSRKGPCETYEVLFIDDGSTDDTAETILSLRTFHPQVKLIKLSRNFGQHAAAQAGFDRCIGDVVVWMDADLQESPEEVEKLLAKLSEGYDLVYGVRKTFGGSRAKRFFSHGFVWIFNKLTRHELPRNASTMRVMTRRFMESANSLPERVRFLAGINAWIGFKRTGVEIDYVVRNAGTSSYTLTRMLQLTGDAIFSFSAAPLRLISAAGFFLAAGSFVAIIGVVVARLLGLMGGSALGWASLIVSIFFIGGVQALFLGLMGEYLVRIYSEVKQRPLYIVEECIGL
jgi:polyisoprenyl-phosphate glycosyltransferase